jgi:hypothetical protein
MLRRLPIRDVSYSTEEVLIVTGLIGGLVTALVAVHKLLIASLAAQLVAANARAENYAEMANAAIDNLEAAVNANRAAQGRGPTAIVPPVVAEHNSPVTEAQQHTADSATMRARLVAATAALGLPPRESALPRDSI